MPLPLCRKEGMAENQLSHILTINTGSSSLKAGLYAVGERKEELVLSAHAERIGQDGGRLAIKDGGGKVLVDRQTDMPRHEQALEELFGWLRSNGFGGELRAVGHRVVHGGSKYSSPALITAQIVDALHELEQIDPDHLPQALAAIGFMGRAMPETPQVACFDTAFHRQMPRVAQMYALPRRYWDTGVVRYGFHGLSYEYIMEELRSIDAKAADGHVVIAHLGNGASMAAVRGGVGIDTTMGFTPTGGLMMGTRSGDLDPGVLLYMLQSEGMSAEAVNKLVNREAGLLGVSGSSADMRDLLEREANDPRAAEAVELFCYTAKKYLGALAAALGGLETLVFTGGIGEHAVRVRERICAGLKFLGIELAPARNEANAAVISVEGSAAVVRVIQTDEDLVIARHTYRLINSTQDRSR
jgi:acetate kinase